MRNKTRIEDLTSAQLDHFCAIAQGWKEGFGEIAQKKVWLSPDGWINYHPTTNAAQCDVIQEREKIDVMHGDSSWFSSLIARSKNETNVINSSGSTAKRAIIACFVKSRLGNEVDVSISKII